MTNDERFSARDLADVSDSPEWTHDELARSKSFAEAFPDLAASLSSGIEIVHADGDVLSVTLSGDVAAYYRSFGEQSEARLNADLRKLAGLPGAS